MVQWQPGQSVEVLPAWARGAVRCRGASAPAGRARVAVADTGAEPASPRPNRRRRSSRRPRSSVQAAAGQLDAPGAAADPDRAGGRVARGAAGADRGAAPLFHVNWARTLAASLLVALLEGVAFATAWWYVTPEQQGWLVVHTKPAGIQIAVDGLVLGQTPFAKALAPGRHTIELRYGTGTRVVPVEISAGVQTEQRLSWGNGFTSGQASISSSTAGSRV